MESKRLSLVAATRKTYFAFGFAPEGFDISPPFFTGLTGAILAITTGK
jgi:hypothetical protein